MAKHHKIKQIAKKVILLLSAIFIICNIFIIVHTYKFTHYVENINKTPETEISPNISSIFFGINLPRPKNNTYPTHKFETITLESNKKKLNGWYIFTDSINCFGTVFLGHGYNGSKSGMLPKAEVFLDNGYNVFIIDFMGSGESEGNTTTIGWDEAKNVKSSYEYLIERGDKNIILFGTSMGAAAIMKAIHDYQEIKPMAVILECPYGTMLKTIEARFKIMNLPQFIAYPFAFWGGTINGFNAFALEPEEYAKDITCPTLLIYGQNDNKVTIEETQIIYNNFAGKKIMKVYPSSGHDNYLVHDKNQWLKDIQYFLHSL